MRQKIKKVLKLYKYWFLSIVKSLFFICLLTIGLAVIILSAPFIISTKVQTALQNMFDKIMRFMYLWGKEMTVAELIKELQNLENINGENLLCLNVVVTDENGDHTIKAVDVVENYYSGESRKVKLNVSCW